MLRLFSIAIAGLLMLPTHAYAQDCTNPNGYVGVILYNQSFDTFQGCTLRGWMAFHDADATPPPDFAFNFVDQSDVSQATEINSNIIQVSGLGTSIPITITGQGSPQFRSCSDASCTTEIDTWGSASITVSDGDYLQLRLTSSSISLQTQNAFLTDGNASQTWSVRTESIDDCAAPSPAPGSVCPDGTVYAGMSPDGNVKMYTTRCDEGQSWNGAVCTGSRVNLAWNNGDTSGYVTTGTGNTVTGEANTGTLDGLDSNSVTGGNQAHQAAQRCADLNVHGHGDWYLPAQQELNVLYLNRLAISNFGLSGSVYWSSSEWSNTSAANQIFTDGSQYSIIKNAVRTLRCVRR